MDSGVVTRLTMLNSLVYKQRKVHFVCLNVTAAKSCNVISCLSETSDTPFSLYPSLSPTLATYNRSKWRQLQKHFRAELTLFKYPLTLFLIFTLKKGNKKRSFFSLSITIGHRPS